MAMIRGRKEYVLGFVFNDEKNKVMLIRKDQGWQKGLLNGIGGKIEIGETAIDAMKRECIEETGLELEGWKCYSTIHCDPICKLHLFYLDSALFGVYRKESDEGLIRFYEIDQLHRERLIHNVRWMIELALDRNTSFTNITTEFK